VGRSWSQKQKGLTMAHIRKHRDKWQSIIRVQGHPHLAKSFASRTDAKRWAIEQELKIRREDAGIAKVNFPKFEDVARRYIEEVSILKRCHRDERYTILVLFREAWSSYPINKIKPSTINKYKDTLGKRVS
jgi:hypothetical protein